KAENTLPEVPQLQLVICQNCGCGFYDKQVEYHYEDVEEIKQGALKCYLEQGAGIDSMAAWLFAVPQAAGVNFLDIGCGFGFCLDFARIVLGWKVKVLDPSWLAKAGREILNLDISPDYLTDDAEIQGAPFDLVLCSEVIEHLFKPQVLVHNLAKI